MSNFVTQRAFIPQQMQLMQAPQHTVGDMFTSSIMNSIAETLIVPICTWLIQYKGVNVTPQELGSIFNIPMMAQQQRLTTGLLSAGTRSSLKGKDVASPGECEYQFVKGAQMGKFCGKPCAEGQRYCTGCLKKRGPKEGTAITPGINNLNHSIIPVVGGMVPTALMSGSRAPMSATCEQLPWYPKGMRDTKDNFMVVTPPTGKPLVFCYYDGINAPRALTDEEREVATKRGYTLPLPGEKFDAKLSEAIDKWRKYEEERGRRQLETIQTQSDQMTKLQEKLAKSQSPSLSLQFNKAKQPSPEERLEKILAFFPDEDAMQIRKKNIGINTIRSMIESPGSDPKFKELLEVMILLNYPESVDDDDQDEEDEEQQDP